MNMPLSDDEKRRLTVDASAFLIRSGIVSKDRRARESGDYAETDEGRERRQTRRQAIARKREFLS